MRDKNSFKKNNPKIVYCTDCGKELILPYTSKIKLCDDCRSIRQKHHFKNFVEQKVLCRKPHCNNIVKTRIKKGTKAKEYIKGPWLCSECTRGPETTERKIICAKCGKVIRKELKKDTYQLHHALYEVCDDCKNEYYVLTKNKAKLVDPNLVFLPFGEDENCDFRLVKKYKVNFYDADGVFIRTSFFKSFSTGKTSKYEMLSPSEINSFEKKQILKKGQRQERPPKERTDISQRMRANNPMKNPETVAKMQATLRSRIESGEISYKKGRESPNYRGNNTIRDVCKSRLYKIWTLPILKRDNFTCTSCGSAKNLQVHHLKPFRDILEESMNKFGISYSERLKPIKDWDPDLLDNLISDILDSHKLEFGVTLCKACHEKEDFYYRPFKGKTKDT